MRVREVLATVLGKADECLLAGIYPQKLGFGHNGRSRMAYAGPSRESDYAALTSWPLLWDEVEETVREFDYLLRAAWEAWRRTPEPVPGERPRVSGESSRVELWETAAVAA